MIPISRVFVGEEEKLAVLEVLESGQLAQGKKVALLEMRFAKMHQAEHAVAVNNGTTALIAALMAHGVGPGDEVIVPSFSFFATASCVLSVGAIPVFADIDPDTYCISPDEVERAMTAKTKAVIAVHLYGQPADLLRLESSCSSRGIPLIQDAAQAHGAAIGDQPVGSSGTAAFSFYSTKNMMCGEGGMVLTDRAEIASKLRTIRNQGMDEQYVHTMVGFNFRMTDLSAAIAIEQLKRLPDWTKWRIANAERLDAELSGVVTPKCRSGVLHVYHQYTIRLPEGCDRSIFLQRLNQAGVGARVYYPTPIHLQPIFRTVPHRCFGSLEHTIAASRSVVSLPVHPHLTEADLQQIISAVKESL